MTDVPPRKRPDPAEVRAAVLAVADWLVDESTPAPSRPVLAAAVRLTARTLEHLAPGNSVEVRVPPYAAVQVIPGVRHTRGTPPAVIEMDAATWIALATGELAWADAEATARVRASGERADLSPYLPLT